MTVRPEQLERRYLDAGKPTHCSECNRKLFDSGRGGSGWHDSWLRHSRSCKRYGHPPDQRGRR